MKRIPRVVVVAGILGMAACATTEQAQQAIDSQFVGQPSDVFFSRYGPPQSSFAMNSGGTSYTWRGGESVINVPAQYKTVEPANTEAAATNTRTTTSVSHPDENTTVTNTRSTSFSIGAPAAQQVMVSPARSVPVFCEAQISVDAKGIIQTIHILRDTQGTGASSIVSRCAEVFGVKG